MLHYFELNTCGSSVERANRHTENVSALVMNSNREQQPLISLLQDADIIVFPECGLVAYGSGTSYATPLPNPEHLVNPCTDTSSSVTEVNL
jgi:hypothetical protein